MSVVIPVPNLASDISWERESYLFRTHVLELIQDYFVTDLRKAYSFLKIIQIQSECGLRIDPSWRCIFCNAGFCKKNDHRFPKDAKISESVFSGCRTHPGPSIPGVLMGAANAVSAD
jgi:hypothetical protein